MAKVTKRSWTNRNGTKSSCWIINYMDDLGKQVRKGGFKTKAEAEDALVEAMNDMKSGKVKNTESDITIGNAVTQFLALHASVNCKKSTHDDYKHVLEKHVIPYFGSLKAKECSLLQIQNFISEKKKEGASNCRINACRKVLKVMFNWLVEVELINSNPFTKVKKLEERRSEIEVLTPEEIVKLLKVSEKSYQRLYPMLYTAIFTGIRQGELLALTWDDVNFHSKKLRINKTFSKSKLGETKTAHSTRYVDLTDELVNVLRVWKLRSGHSVSNLVFPSLNGGYMNPSNFVQRQFNPALTKAGLAKIRWHDLRHTYASLLISKNIPIKYIQKQLGHGSIEITMDTYGHLLPDVNENAVKALSEIIKVENTSTNLAQSYIQSSQKAMPTA